MKAAARLSIALAVAGLAMAGPALAQTRGDQTSPKPTISSVPPRTTQTSPTRTAPTTLPVDPGGLSGLPSSGSPVQAGPDYGPMGPGGGRTTRPRRATTAPADSPPVDDTPYVDPPAAPGYESATDTGPMKTAGGKPAPGAAAPPTAPVTASVGPPPAPAAQPSGTPPPPPPSSGYNKVTVIDAATPTGLPDNALWIVLGGLAVMLGAAGLGLRHILTAPHLTFRVTVDHGVQSAPRFKGTGA